MTAFNAVRFRVKPGRDQEFLDAHKKVQADWPGLNHVNMIKTGERSYCIIAEWSDMDALANARPHMIATLILPCGIDVAGVARIACRTRPAVRLPAWLEVRKPE